jgi:hypothetical protein
MSVSFRPWVILKPAPQALHARTKLIGNCFSVLIGGDNLGRQDNQQLLAIRLASVIAKQGAENGNIRETGYASL